MNRPETSVLIHNEEYRLYRIRSEKPLKRPKVQQAISLRCACHIDLTNADILLFLLQLLLLPFFFKIKK